MAMSEMRQQMLGQAQGARKRQQGRLICSRKTGLIILTISERTSEDCA